MKKKRIVENDKATIEAVIKELDEKKNEALRKAWQQINKVRFISGFCTPSYLFEVKPLSYVIDIYMLQHYRQLQLYFQDFGSIFSTLLPGTQAKLVPPEGMNILDGLEVKIAFGDVWKESLQELSGGQR